MTDIDKTAKKVFKREKKSLSRDIRLSKYEQFTSGVGALLVGSEMLKNANDLSTVVAGATVLLLIGAYARVSMKECKEKQIKLDELIKNRALQKTRV